MIVPPQNFAKLSTAPCAAKRHSVSLRIHPRAATTGRDDLALLFCCPSGFPPHSLRCAAPASGPASNPASGQHAETPLGLPDQRPRPDPAVPLRPLCQTACASSSAAMPRPPAPPKCGCKWTLARSTRAMSERGFAHYVEHMAFNGSTQRARGRDDQASRARRPRLRGRYQRADLASSRRLYMLESAARHDAEAARHRADADARNRQRAQLRSRRGRPRTRGRALRTARRRRAMGSPTRSDQLAFFYPAARYPQRLPIGTPEIAPKSASAAALQRRSGRADYVPAKTTLIVVGDFDADAVGSRNPRPLCRRGPARACRTAPRCGPRAAQAARRRPTSTSIPRLSERITVSRHGPWRR